MNKGKEKSKDWAFVTGWSQVPNEKIKEIRKEIYKALGSNNRATFMRHLKGISMHTAQQAKDIEDVFKSNGIKKIWGVTPFYNGKTETNKVQ